MTWGMGQSQVEDHAITAGANTPAGFGVHRRAVRRVATAAVDVAELVELLGMLGLDAREGK